MRVMEHNSKWLLGVSWAGTVGTVALDNVDTVVAIICGIGSIIATIFLIIHHYRGNRADEAKELFYVTQICIACKTPNDCPLPARERPKQCPKKTKLHRL